MKNLKKLSELLCPQCGSGKLTAKKNDDLHKFEINCQSCNHQFEPDDAAVSEKDFQEKKNENAKQKRWISVVVSVLIMAAVVIFYIGYQDIK